MKTNIFRVREKEEKKIVIEEERTKNPFLIFFRRHKNFILLSLFLLGICVLLIGTGVAVSLFQSSTELDISFLGDDGDTITTNNDSNITDDVVSEDLLGEISRTEGVVILVESFMTSDGDIVYYFSDKSSIIVMSDGKIYRVSSLDDGSYGVDRDGNIDSSAKKILVTSTTSTLSNGEVITYYSDGTAKIEYNNITLFIRDSSNIKLTGGNILYNIVPSGVAPQSSSTKLSESKTVVKFTDNTYELSVNDTKYIINPKSNVSLDGDDFQYDSNNVFSVLSEVTLSDGNTITYYQNGSAVITDSSNNKIYVKKSGDITIKDNAIYEIITNDYGYSKSTINCGDGTKVTYFDNGAAIITYTDGTKKYVEDSDEILYDSSGNISSTPTTSSEISTKETTNGYEVVNFDNGKSQVIKPDGSSYITDTSKITFASSGDLEEPEVSTDDDKSDDSDDDKDKDDTDDDTVVEDPTEGLYVSEAEHTYNYSKSVEDSTFIIRNTSSKQKKYRIVIEEVDDYSLYNASRLNPYYVKFQATVEDTLISATSLTSNTWYDENNKVNYVIYDGVIGAKDTIDVAISLYVDYADLDNSYQDKAFIGTIKVYVIS